MNEERDPRERLMAEVIWETSRADEGTISATGADIIARALMPSILEWGGVAREGGYLYAVAKVEAALAKIDDQDGLEGIRATLYEKG